MVKKKIEEDYVLGRLVGEVLSFQNDQMAGTIVGDREKLGGAKSLR